MDGGGDTEVRESGVGPTQLQSHHLPAISITPSLARSIPLEGLPSLLHVPSLLLC